MPRAQRPRKPRQAAPPGLGKLLPPELPGGLSRGLWLLGWSAPTRLWAAHQLPGPREVWPRAREAGPGVPAVPPREPSVHPGTDGTRTLPTLTRGVADPSPALQALRSYNPPASSKRKRRRNFEMKGPLNPKLLDLCKILTFPQEVPGGAFGTAASQRKRWAGPTSVLHASPSSPSPREFPLRKASGFHSGS